MLGLTGQGFSDSPSDASNRQYKQDRDGAFSDMTQAAGLFGAGYFYRVTFTDHNNNGFDDIFLTGWPQTTHVTKYDRLLNATALRLCLLRRA